MLAVTQADWTFNVKAIAVIGAGTMGAGVAQLAATHGCTVYLNDVDGDAIQRGIDGIAARLERSVDKGRLKRRDRDAVWGRIKPVDTISDLSDVDLAIEAVVEDLAVKQQVFATLGEALPASAVLATNTSSLSITRIAEAVEDPSRVVGMHFFNPAPVMPLVEVIAGRASADASVEFACKAAEGWGKVPVRAKDTPGFIVNRVARGFYLEALRLHGEGVAGIDEIDAVMRTHGKFKMGPFELMDLIGLDVNLAATTSIWEQMGKPARFRVHELQQRLVDQGYLGRKSGRGFYLHDGETPVPAMAVDRRSYELSPLLSDAMLAFSEKGGAARTSSNERYVFCRILGAIINEAGLLVSEDVATRKDIDVAMVKGANYPKGPLAWADDIGHRTVRGLLKALNTTVSDGRYEPAPLFADAQ